MKPAAGGGAGACLRGWARRLAWRLRPPVLALGGGGARGFAHIGVLRLLDELRLPVGAIAGTSMGAVIGAMYLAHGSAEAVLELWREAIARELLPPVREIRMRPEAGAREHPLVQVARRIRNRVVITFAVNRSTVLDDDALVRALDCLVPDVEVDALARPFVAVATDVDSGEEVRLREGPLRAVLKASSAIPGLLPPVELAGRRLLDGGVVAEVPVAAAHSLGGPVLAVDVSMDLPPLGGREVVLDTIMRTQMMTARLLRQRLLRGCRTVLRPDVGHATWSDWGLLDELVERGHSAAADLLEPAGGSAS